MNHRRQISLVATLVGAVLLLTGCGRADQLASDPSLSPTPVPLLSPTPIPPLGSPGAPTSTRVPPSPTPPEAPPPIVSPTASHIREDIATRQAAEQAQDQSILATVTAHALTPVPTPYPQPPPGWVPPTVVLPLGLIASTSPGEYTCCMFENAWRGIVDDHYMLVYAGALRQDTQQGAIVVFIHTRSMDYFDGPLEFFTPVSAGSLHIVAASNGRLTLRSTGGQTFLFDSETRAWVTP